MQSEKTGWHEVLIITGGMTPQVVTETVYELARSASGAVVPAKIVCVVTGESAGRFGKPLEAALQCLRAELGAEADWGRKAFSWEGSDRGLHVEVPCDSDGRVIGDIRGDDDAVRFGDLVANIVRHETLNSKTRVHLSLAGGRKTMSFHAGMAMGLFGRPQDELSHVLVHPREFEQCPDFWFPTKEPLTLPCSDGTMRDARDCRIELARIPFIRVRELLPEGLTTRAMDYASYVRQLNSVLGATSVQLKLVTSLCRVQIREITDFTLPNTEFALYQLMAEWRRDACAGAGPDGIGTGHRGWMTARMFERPEEYEPNPIARYMDIYDQTFRVGHKRAGGIKYEITDAPDRDKQRIGNAKHFREWKSRLQNALQGRLFHPALADRFGAPLRPVKTRPGNRVVFGLRLQPHEIVISEEELLTEKASQ